MHIETIRTEYPSSAGSTRTKKSDTPSEVLTENANLKTGEIKPKLPKLHLPKFSGQITKFQIFWDSFESAVHNNYPVRMHKGLSDWLCLSICLSVCLSVCLGPPKTLIYKVQAIMLKLNMFKVYYTFKNLLLYTFCVTYTLQTLLFGSKFICACI